MTVFWGPNWSTATASCRWALRKHGAVIFPTTLGGFIKLVSMSNVMRGFWWKKTIQLIDPPVFNIAMETTIQLIKNGDFPWSIRTAASDSAFGVVLQPKNSSPAAPNWAPNTNGAALGRQGVLMCEGTVCPRSFNGFGLKMRMAPLIGYWWYLSISKILENMGKYDFRLLKMQGYPVVRQIFTMKMKPQQKNWVGKGHSVMFDLKRSSLSSMWHFCECR